MITYDKDEKIRYITRRHRTGFSIEVIVLIISALLPYIAYGSGFINWINLLFNPSGQSPFFLFVALYTLWLLFIWLLFFIAWSDYRLDVWIITDGRIIDVEQTGIFRRQINSFRLDKITDVVVMEQNWFEKLFNYGSLNVAVEGDSKNFIISEVPEPKKLKDLITTEQKNILERLRKNISPTI